jgi:hypothetical protein
MRLMRIEEFNGPERVNPSRVQRIWPVAEYGKRPTVWMQFSMVYDPTQDASDGMHVYGTLDEIAAEWAAAMRGEEREEREWPR